MSPGKISSDFASVYQHTPAASLRHACAQDCYLAYFLTELAGATAIIFARTCDGARKLALLLRNLGFDALPIHGQMSQPKRLGALNKFKAGERSILVATGAPGHLLCVLLLVEGSHARQ